MADQQNPKDAKVARRVEELLAGEKPEVLRALKFALNQQSRVGRPPGSGQDDSEAIEFMMDLLRKGKVQSEGDAVAAAADRFPGHSKPATRKRLNRKLAEHLKATAKSPEQVAREARRAEVLRRAFEEDVAWDI